MYVTPSAGGDAWVGTLFAAVVLFGIPVLCWIVGRIQRLMDPNYGKKKITKASYKRAIDQGRTVDLKVYQIVEDVSQL